MPERYEPTDRPVLELERREPGYPANPNPERAVRHTKATMITLTLTTIAMGKGGPVRPGSVAVRAGSLAFGRLREPATTEHSRAAEG